MTTETRSLSAWLLDAIAADEVAAQAAADDAPNWGGITWEECALEIGEDRAGPQLGARMTPARVLATCAAHRAIVEAASDILAEGDWEYDDAPELAKEALRAIASVYKDRDGFDERWAPL